MEVSSSGDPLKKDHCLNDSDEQIPNLTFQPNLDSPIKKKRQPRKILHFSDGTLEEYSTDEDENDSENLVNKTVEIDASVLPWNQWFVHHGKKGGQTIVAACDYLGEGLANAFGITSQKYFYEVEEYKRAVEEEENERKEEEEQMAGWNSGPKIEMTTAEKVEEEIQTKIPEQAQLGDSDRF